jgi:hypothetical protein
MPSTSQLGVSPDTSKATRKDRALRFERVQQMGLHVNHPDRRDAPCKSQRCAMQPPTSRAPSRPGPLYATPPWQGHADACSTRRIKGSAFFMVP